MTFADELRSNKGPQLVKEEISSRQYRLNLHVKAVLEELKRFALSQNNAGKHSVSGYLAYAGYDKDYWRLLPIKDKILPRDDIGAGSFGVKNVCYSDCINDLRSEIEKGLKQLGFKASVKKIDVQFYKETDGFLGRKRLEKDGTDTTLRIDFSW
ncbi:MAG: hypothetical protein ACLVIT_08605 [Coprococcus sp.]|jgi:hypothetical protein|uniref:hypothetical protein n=1 Tax=Coprococcus catus TaxID=116085 RepID=UPI001D065E38|nr:hypothetical protein [Coprococcus catus]MCB6492165.1 hypothetical protein [Coprococcus catus]MEE0817151.1 hypothetical protein [Coprococcus catus]